ncbi:MAG: hypothetical protein ACHQFX_13380 [Chitinophagales bacterium]
MEKYLFTDGTNVIREVESREELQSLIQSSAEPAKVRIWIFNSNEWISVADFNKRASGQNSQVKKAETVAAVKEPPAPRRKSSIPGYLKKAAIGIAGAAAIFLVYNFTRVTWRKGSALSIAAERPENTPPVNVDSLIETVELLRGQRLDKITRTNLRIRNTWPDLIQLQLTADRDISKNGSKYYNAEVSIDNSTGYNLDDAVVKLDVWKDNEVSGSDTIHFSNITYAALAKRKLEPIYRGDSLSVSFITIKSKVFNFCYSSEKKSNYGNYNDRWFCRE